MFAALVAGLLILLIALTLIVLKLGFLLLLLVAGPFFLLIGTHPGFGRIIAIRWFEMLVGVLLKQVAVAIVLSVLLYCYSLIMGTTNQALPWALKILMIALVMVAVFIYRKPFTHLFSAVGYGTLGSSERAEVSLREAGFTFRRSTLDAATVAIPGVAGYRAARGRAATRARSRRPPRRERPPPEPVPGREQRATRTRRGSGPTRPRRPTGTARPARAHAAAPCPRGGLGGRPCRPSPRAFLNNLSTGQPGQFLIGHVLAQLRHVEQLEQIRPHRHYRLLPDRHVAVAVGIQRADQVHLPPFRRHGRMVVAGVPAA